ncbi:ComEA family DNA-binding protein [Paenibacillus hodogayensis]|uniref:ComEA family DNA-binding protein n=1 Tax=Paenibacillus hodogayensis TaxID=279208 RepID=A0ABV5VVC0_9BACL
METKSAARWTAIAIWGTLALLLWAIVRLVQGNVAHNAAVTVRDAEMAALFAGGGEQGGKAGKGSSKTGQTPVAGSAATAGAVAVDGGNPPVAEPAAPQAAGGAEHSPGSAADAGSPGPKETFDSRGLIDLNRATAAELIKLPGIGPSKAQAIVDHRDRQGSFRSIDELKKVKGIGAKTFETLKPLITVGP